MQNFYRYTYPQLEEYFLSIGEKKYRARQLFHWIYEYENLDILSYTDFKLDLREKLSQEFHFKLPEIHTQRESLDGTVKLLLKLADGLLVETVLMRYSYGNVVCVSSQVGCAMGCKFCASGLLKKIRSLTVEELMGQVLVINKILKDEGQGQKVTHIVIMGTGEPFDNYDNVMNFIRLLNHPHALAIGARHITVSTCGIVPKIYEYAHEPLQINLAISLHATNDEIRSKIMPINQAYPLEKLMEAINYYLTTAKRRITIEYILIDQLNDNLEQAEQLVQLFRGKLAYINLIPYNEISGQPFKRPSGNRIHRFQAYLNEQGITSTIRKEFGSDIEAACGQLQAKVRSQHETR